MQPLHCKYLRYLYCSPVVLYNLSARVNKESKTSGTRVKSGYNDTTK